MRFASIHLATAISFLASLQVVSAVSCNSYQDCDATVFGGSFSCNASRVCVAKQCYAGYAPNTDSTLCLPSDVSVPCKTQTNCPPVGGQLGYSTCVSTSDGNGGFCMASCYGGLSYNANYTCFPSPNFPISACPNGQMCNPPDNSTAFCNGVGACDFTCNGNLTRQDSSCVSVVTPPPVVTPPANLTCNSLLCPTSAFGVPICTNNACDISCRNGAVKANGTCVCPSTANGCKTVTGVSCGSNNDCSTVYGGVFTCSAGVCLVQGSCYAGFAANSKRTACLPSSANVTCNASLACPVAVLGQSNCVYPSGSKNGTCVVSCPSYSFNANGTCFPNPPIAPYSSCPNAETCGTPPNNSISICNSAGACDFACKTGFGRQGLGCVNTTCDASRCPTSAFGTPICTNNKCALSCYSGAVKANGTCVCTDPAVCGCNGLCPTLSGGSFRCNATTQACYTNTTGTGACYAGFTLSGNACVPSTSTSNTSITCLDNGDCPQPFPTKSGNNTCVLGSNKSGTCSLMCNAGYSSVNGMCLPVAGAVVKTCANGATCSLPPINATTTCSISGVCDFSCNTGFLRRGLGCVSTTAPPVNTYFETCVGPAPDAYSPPVNLCTQTYVPGGATACNSTQDCVASCYAGFASSADGKSCPPSSATVSCQLDTDCPRVALDGLGYSTCVNATSSAKGTCAPICSSVSGYVANNTCFPYNSSVSLIQACPNGLGCPAAPIGAVSFCNSAGACDYACAPTYVQQGSACLCSPLVCNQLGFGNAGTAICKNNACATICDPSKCPAVQYGGQATCTNNQCDVLCANGAVRTVTNGSPSCQCNDGSGCYPTNTTACNATCYSRTGGAFECRSESGFANGGCRLSLSGGGLCYAGFTLSYSSFSLDQVCVPVPTNATAVMCFSDTFCPQPYPAGSGQSVCIGSSAGIAGTCSLTCSPGYSKLNGMCFLNAGSIPATCPNGGFCPAAPANSTTVCNKQGACDFTCNTGFTKSGSGCVSTSAVCNPTKCPTSPYGTAVCRNNTCDLTCAKGSTKVNGICGCVKQPIALYLDYHTTANGQPAFTVSSLVECASACVAQNCTAFDFWNGNQCGLQLSGQGGPFEGFRPSLDCVHGVPGNCGNYTTQPGYCWNDSFCPSTPLTITARSPLKVRQRTPPA